MVVGLPDVTFGLENLYWITDGTYTSAFQTTSDGVVVLDAPPTIGNNIQLHHTSKA